MYLPLNKSFDAHLNKMIWIWIFFIQECSVPSLVELRPVLLKKMKIWKVYDNNTDLRKFAALHRLWWRFQMSEKFSSGANNPIQTNKQPNKQTTIELVKFVLLSKVYSLKPCSSISNFLPFLFKTVILIECLCRRHNTVISNSFD